MVSIKFEEVLFSDKVPLRVYMYSLGYIEPHWHKTTELIMVLEGNLSVSVENKTYTLGPTDIILINSGAPHELHSENSVIVSIQLNLSEINHFEEKLENIRFECNSTTSSHPELFDGIRFAFAVLIRQNLWNPQYIDYQNYSICYYLIADLLRYFQYEPVDIRDKSNLKSIHISKILNYLDSHYSEDLTLTQVAEAEDLSPSYVSSLFSQYLDTTFLKYYTRLRLEHAKEELIHTDKTIEAIAKSNGFSEIHTFTRRFKKEFQTLPSEYRKSMAKHSQNNYGTLNYIGVDPKNYMELTEKYVVMLDYSYSSSTKPLVDALSPINVDCNNIIANLKHTYRDVITIINTSDLLDRNSQEMLADFQSTIHASYIKLIDIFSDRLITAVTEGHHIQCNYYLLDSIIDFVLSLDAKPYICLSYTPTSLSANRRGNVSVPESITTWTSLVSNFVYHAINHYGIREVETWRFSIWDGNHTEVFGDESAFFRLYRSTYRLLRQINSRLAIGSPALSYMPGTKTERFFRHFISFSRKNNCEPDFIDFKYYAFSDVNPSLNERNDDFSLWVGSVRKTLSNLELGDVPVYLTEYSFSNRQDVLLQDTCYQSCYLMKNLLANYDRLDAFGCGSVSDFSHTYMLADRLFHGGNGLYSANGLKKASYYVYAFLNELGDHLISVGDGFFMTKSNDSYKIITYNYVHYRKGFNPKLQAQQEDKNRYQVFDTSRKIQITLALHNFTPGNYEIRDYYINREFGSAYDIWVQQGSEVLNSRETEYLKAQCIPGFKKSVSRIDSTDYTHRLVLEPLEIRLTEIKYISPL